jgi:hypothetical protein
MRGLPITVAWTVALLAGGCDAQAGSDYDGQPLATLRGTVNNTSGVPPVYEIDAALLWRARNPVAPDAIMGATPVRIEKLFPAQFTITVFLPPPATALAATTLPYAVASVGAITRGAPPAQIADGSAVLGQLADPLLYYFRAPVPRGLLQEQYGALAKGYHLIQRRQTLDPAALTAAQVDDCARTLTADSPDLAFADAQSECAQSLLSHTSQELPLDTPVLLVVKNP